MAPRAMALGVSVIVPVCNEEVMLRKTAPALKTALTGLDAAIIYVLNGTEDDSAAVIGGVFGTGAKIVTLEQSGKTAALQHGDAQTDVFPRFYLDADIAPCAEGFAALLGPLISGEADLTAAPAKPYPDPHASWGARAVGRIWAALPYANTRAFQCIIGISRQGRENWDRWPDVIADDLFIAGRIAPDRKRIVGNVPTEIPLPRSLRAWVGVRSRWLRGARELHRKRLTGPPEPFGQTRALLVLLRRPTNWIPVGLFLAVRIAAELRLDSTGWVRDETIRR